MIEAREAGLVVRRVFSAPNSGLSTSRRVGAALGVVGASFLIGVALTAVAAHAGDLAPLLLIGLPAGAAALLIGLRHPVAAIGLFVLGLPAALLSTGDSTFQLAQLLAIATAVLALVARWFVGGWPTGKVRPLGWVVVLILLTVAATPSAIDAGLAVRQDANLIAGALLAVAVSAACVRIRDLRRLLVAFTIVGALMCIPGLAQSGNLQASFGAAVVNNRAIGLFTQPNQLGSFSAVVALVGCGLLLGSRRSGERAVLSGCVLVATAALALSLSRGAWIGVAAGGVLLLYLLPWSRRVAVVLGVVGLASVIGYGVTQPAPQLQVVSQRLETIGSPESNPYDERPAIYREALREIHAKPLTGEGPGNFPVASQRTTEGQGIVSAAHAHNVPLTVAAEEGVPAAVILMIFTISVGVRVRRVRKWPARRERATLAAVGAALVSVVAHGLVDYTMINIVVFLVDWFLVGAGLVLVREVDLRSRTADVGGTPAAHRPPLT